MTDWKLILSDEDVVKINRMDYNALVAVATPECDITNFPRALITVRGGIVVKMISILDNTNCTIPDMRGWYVEQLYDWMTDDTSPAPLHLIAWEV